jgi:hypothetical protein
MEAKMSFSKAEEICLYWEIQADNGGGMGVSSFLAQRPSEEAEYDAAYEIIQAARPTYFGEVGVINVTPHSITFEWDGEPVNVSTSGVVINATPQETVIEERFGATLVRTVFVGNDDSERDLMALRRRFPRALLVGSIIAAQAYPGQVVAMVPAPGFERVPPADKRMRPDKFTTF